MYGSVTAGLYADDNAFFTSVTTLSAVDGWNGYWSIANGKLYFGDNLVTENVIDKTATAVFDFDRASGSDYTLAVTGIDAGLTVEDITAVKTVSDGTMLSFTKSGDNLVFANAVLSGYIGEQQVYLVTSAAKYKVTICMASDILTTKDEFVAYFNANANKTTSADTYVVLKTDVDMASAKWNYGWPITPASQFQGTFDGRGHIVSNFNTRRGIFWNILSGGTVKNLYVNSPIVGSGAGGGLCYDNAGTIENCAIVTRITAGEKSVPFAGLTVTNSGTVRNCFVKIESYTWYDTAKEFNAVVGSNTGTVSNCYAVASSEYVTAIYGTVTAGLYVSDAAFFESVTTLPAGWNAYWSLSGGTLSFGGNTVIANT